MLKQKNRQRSYTFRKVLLAITLPLMGWQPVAATTNPPPQSLPQFPHVNTQVYLPIVFRAIGTPEFIINSPVGGQTIAGTSFFSAQPLNASSVSSVQFKAGGKNLGADDTAADGFKVLLDAGQFVTGTLELTAIAIGPGGTATQTVAVSVQPNPPANAVVNDQGATVATAIGSIVNVPAGGAAQGTTLSVAERTQAQVTADNKINWDAMQVTFLGAQKLTASGPLVQPLNVASAGFGNRVQPGQAVVNYMITPDADGDGVDELVAVNTASVAGNNFVISDPILKPNVASLSFRPKSGATRTLRAEAAQSPNDVSSGPPGTTIAIQVSGFNPSSVRGNLAIFQSKVNSETLSLPGFILATRTGQMLQTAIPNLPPGPALLTLRNESTGATVGPFAITVLAPEPLSKPATTLYRDFLSDLITNFQAVSTTNAEDTAAKNKAVTGLLQVRDEFDAMVTAGLSVSMTQAINDAATMIQGLPGYRLGGPEQLGVEVINDFEGRVSDSLNAAWAISGAVATKWPNPYTVGAFLVVSGLVGAYYICRVIRDGACFGDPTPPPPPPCPPSQSGGGGGGTTGMGSVLPTGGPGCGNAGGGGGGGLFNRLRPEQTLTAAGRYIIRIFNKSGTQIISPFSGRTDAGGYFYIPIIPQNEPFKAVAIDTLTGASAVREGVGMPVTGSVQLDFNFSEAASNLFPYTIGDTIADGVPAKGAGNIEISGGLDIYTFNATAGQRVFLDVITYTQNTGGRKVELQDSTGARVQTTCFNCQADVVTLARGGVYTLTVGGDGTVAGTYSLSLRNAPTPQQFAVSIGDTIANGVPGPGAGNIEERAGMDVYTLNATPGQRVFIQVISHPPGTNQRAIHVFDSTGIDVYYTSFSAGLFAVTMSRGGAYTLTVGGDGVLVTGPYSLKLQAAGSAQEFAIAIGDTVAPNVPGVGAGNIESLGGIDIYSFTATAGQRVFYEVVTHTRSVDNKSIHLEDSTGKVLHQSALYCCSMPVIVLTRTATYRLVVGDDTYPETGTYSVKLWGVPPPDQFAVAVGDTFSNGVPTVGAGNIETRGGTDIYTFNGPPVSGQKVFVDVQRPGVNNSLGSVDLEPVFYCGGYCNNVQHLVTLSANGKYTVTVGGDSDTQPGPYRLTLWNVPPPDRFVINIGDTITNGVPGPGAGNLETPGVQDIYTFTATPGQQVFVDNQGYTGANFGAVNWVVTEDTGKVIVGNQFTYGDSGARTLTRGGAYKLIVNNPPSSSDTERYYTGTYQIKLWNVSQPNQFAINIGDTITQGVPGPGAGFIESPGVKDVYTFDATAGQQVYFDLQGFDPSFMQRFAVAYWSLVDSAGTSIFNACFGCDDSGLQTLTRGGHYTLTVDPGSVDGVGAYGFKLWSVPPPNQFAINVGDVISDGIPGTGAGNIESPGAQDLYTFNATPGQQVYFDMQNYTGAGMSAVGWWLRDSTGAYIFHKCLGCGSPGTKTLTAGGTYTITVNTGLANDAATGTYRFQIRNP